MAQKIKGITKGIRTTKGLSTKAIMNMDVYKLNTKSLRQVTSRLISSANKRIRRLQKQAPHSRALQMHPNEFSLKGIKKNDRNSVESLMKDIRNFLNAESSTLKGYKKQRERISEEIGDFESIDQENEFWHIYNEWVDKNPNLANRFNDSFQLRDMIFERYVQKGMTAKGTKSSITQAVKKMLKDINDYDDNVEKQMKDMLENDDAFETTSDF